MDNGGYGGLIYFVGARLHRGSNSCQGRGGKTKEGVVFPEEEDVSRLASV